MRRLYPLAGGRRLIADPDHLAAFQGSQVTHDIGPPVAVTDHTKPNYGIRFNELLVYTDTSGCRSWRKSWHGMAPIVFWIKELLGWQGQIGSKIIGNSTLASAVTGHHCFRCLQKNLQVEQGRTIAGVLQVQPHHVVKFHAAATFHLPQSGDAGLGFE